MDFREALMANSSSMGGKPYEGEKFQGRVHGIFGTTVKADMAYNKFKDEYETEEQGILFMRTMPGMEDPLNTQVLYNKELGDWMDTCEDRDNSLGETFMKWLCPMKEELPGFPDACFVYWRSRKGKLAAFAGKEVEVDMVVKIPHAKPGYPIRTCFVEIKSITNVFTKKKEELAQRRRARRGGRNQAAPAQQTVPAAPAQNLQGSATSCQEAYDELTQQQTTQAAPQQVQQQAAPKQQRRRRRTKAEMEAAKSGQVEHGGQQAAQGASSAPQAGQGLPQSNVDSMFDM